jgi:serine-type D-Ala-D-Ala carboxypeptidase (penicillin-binding protein 5/6)
MDWLKKTSIESIIIIALSFGVVGLIVFNKIEDRGNTASLSDLREDIPLEIISKEDLKELAFGDLEISAKAFAVFDVNQDEIIYSRNADAQLPLASLTKLMTAVVAKDLLKDHVNITIESDHLRAEGDSGLFSGEVWRFKDILSFTLMVSSNDGAESLAAVAGARGKQLNLDGSDEKVGSFLEAMTNTALKLGLTQTFFLNGSGLDTNNSVSGGYGSARDMALLFTEAIREIPDSVESTSYKKLTFNSLSGFVHEAENTNKLVDSIPALIGGKTGFTDLAGGNLVVAFDAGIMKPIVVSVLGSTQEGRFQDVEALVWATLEYMDGI